MTTAQALISVAVIAVITFLTRAIPFLVFPDNRPVPLFVAYLGGMLPYAVIGMLVVYCLKSVSVTEFPFGLPEAIAVAAVVAAHKWKHNLLFSILGGTVLYMVMVQAVFV